MRSQHILIVAAVLAISTAGQSSTLLAQDDNRDQDKQTRDRARAPEQRALSGIEREVRHELVMLPYYGVFDNLAFQVQGSTVTLNGQVTRPTLKSSAERVVKSVEGVEKVVNNIEVLPLSPNDDQIRIGDLSRHLRPHSAESLRATGSTSYSHNREERECYSRRHGCDRNG